MGVRQVRGLAGAAARRWSRRSRLACTAAWRPPPTCATHTRRSHRVSCAPREGARPWQCTACGGLGPPADARVLRLPLVHPRARLLLARLEPVGDRAHAGAVHVGVRDRLHRIALALLHLLGRLVTELRRHRLGSTRGTRGAQSQQRTEGRCTAWVVRCARCAWVWPRLEEVELLSVTVRYCLLPRVAQVGSEDCLHIELLSVTVRYCPLLSVTVCYHVWRRWGARASP